MQFKYIIPILLCLSMVSCSPFEFIDAIYQDQSHSINTYPAANHIHINLSKLQAIDLKQFKQPKERANHLPNFSIVMASSGGGYRASNLMIGTMMGLDKLRTNKSHSSFLRNIDYFSSTSGSGLAIGFYLSSYLDYLIKPTNNRPFNFTKIIRQTLYKDQHLNQPNVLRKSLNQFLFTGKTESAQELEEAINKRLFSRHGHSLQLGDIFIDQYSNQQALLPLWFANASIYQNMSIFPFYNKILSDHRVIAYRHNFHLYQYKPGTSRNEFYNHIPLSVATTASASYPMALPATTLFSSACTPHCYLQLIDGGVTDNLGIITALNILLKDPSKIKVLMILDASRNRDNPFSKNIEPPNLINMIKKIPDMITEARREQLENSINSIATDMLCQNGASNVIVMTFSLNRYPSAKHIDTSFKLSLDDQKTLLNIGQRMIANNKTLKQLIEQINRGKVKIGQCPTPLSILRKRLSLHHTLSTPLTPLKKTLK